MKMVRNRRLFLEFISVLVLLQVCMDVQAESTIEQGRQLYLSYGCAVCHGENGDGMSIITRKLDPPPINFHDPNAYHNGTSRQKIIESIKFGVTRPGSVMPSYDHLTADELDQIASFVGSLISNERAEDHNIRVYDVWVRWQPPVRPNSAAYMIIENKSQKEIVLTSVTSSLVESIELHTMENDNGIMKMRQAEEIRVPAGESVELKPQGRHLMLFGIQKPLERADKIPLSFTFQDGSVVDVEAVVKGQDEE